MRNDALDGLRNDPTLWQPLLFPDIHRSGCAKETRLVQSDLERTCIPVRREGKRALFFCCIPGKSGIECRYRWSIGNRERERRMTEEVLCSIQDGIATLTLNRPAKRNALNKTSIASLATHFTRFEQRQDVRVVVIRGAGKAFCAGRDLQELHQQQTDGRSSQSDILSLFRQIETSPYPTIAMINGDAFAGGCELAVHCDLRIAAEEARFGMPLARLGFMVPFTLTSKLVEIIGPAFTRQFLFTARPIGAKRAYEIGLVHQVVPRAELEETTYTMARDIATNAPLALRGIKASILRATSLREQIAHEDLDTLFYRTLQSADAREGIRAWMEKRLPVFRGE
ncbi:MAG: hypothetical protein D6736_13565 [Nitrospinota bacterium]|nr:MAG: hypothetical protein D6736_13565 [Nitrospinota bacterium]